MFLFSKIIGILLSPLLWVIMLFIAAWIIKKPGEKEKDFYTGNDHDAAFLPIAGSFKT